VRRWVWMGAPAALLAVVVLSAMSCGVGDELIVASTTSVRDTGLLDELVQEFKQRNPDAGTVKPVAAGSGQLVELARRGEVDVIISHWPEGEAQLIAEDQAIDRRPFMYNFFVVVGPSDDPAGVRAAASPLEAFGLIAEEEALFISRGDGSGTNMRELAIWEEAGIDPTSRSWYQESGAGQAASLLVASDKGAYTLVDGATWTVLEERAELTLYVSDSEVPNLYSVLPVNPDKHDVNEEAALAFADFLTSPAGQAVIEEFGRQEYDQPLFTPGNPARKVTPTPISTP
jgi:tungstate transport system substrate-binding protein